MSASIQDQHHLISRYHNRRFRRIRGRSMLREVMRWREVRRRRRRRIPDDVLRGWDDDDEPREKVNWIKEGF